MAPSAVPTRRRSNNAASNTITLSFYSSIAPAHCTAFESTNRGSRDSNLFCERTTRPVSAPEQIRRRIERAIHPGGVVLAPPSSERLSRDGFRLPPLTGRVARNRGSAHYQAD